MSANVLEIADMKELSITSSESINFSCYKMSEKVEWFLDSGCTDHITPRKSDFVQYRELRQLHKVEITDGKYLKIVLRFNLVRVEIRELRPEVVAESDEVLVHYRSRTNV